MAYLIEHTDDCDCQDREAPVCQTPFDVAVFFWGRDVRAHVVYQGECPFRFFVGDLRLIEALLTDCPVAAVRPSLPCSFWAGSMLLVTIGDPDDQGFRELSYMQWIKGAVRCPPLIPPTPHESASALKRTHLRHAPMPRLWYTRACFLR